MLARKHTMHYVTKIGERYTHVRMREVLAKNLKAVKRERDTLKDLDGVDENSMEVMLYWLLNQYNPVNDMMM